MPTGAELFIQSLDSLGIREIFTLVGDHLNEVLLAAARANFRILDMRHESGVTHAADTWARLHRRPAVALVTGGPGHTNALTGIATAHLACSPLLAISGSRASTMADRNAFQDIDQVGMTRPVVKWAAEPPNTAQIPFYLGRAYALANSGRRGAVHLTIPVDLFAGRTETPSALPVPAPAVAAAPDPRDVRRALELLRAAERPAIIAGSGVWWSDACAEVQEFIERTSLPLFTLTAARGAVSDDHPLYLGYAHPALNSNAPAAFQDADVILVLGKRIDFRLAMGGPRLFSPKTKFIQVDIEPTELGLNRRLEVAICADLKATLRAFLDELPAAPWPELPWLTRLRQLKSDWQEKLAAYAAEGGTPLHAAAFYAELKKHLPPDLFYAWDGGDFVHWGRAMLPAGRPGRWIRLGPLGTIGSALPNSLAVQMANPGRPVLMITGDGSLGFYIAEIDTAVRHKLPVILIVGNDGGWGLERELQGASGKPTVACELRRTRYDLVTQAFGGGGETVDTLDQVAPAFGRALGSGLPYCLNVNIRGTQSPFAQWQLAGKK